MTNDPDLDPSGFADIVVFAGSTDEQPDPRAFMHAFVSPSAVAAVLKFAFPRFVEHRGGVFLEFAFDAQKVDTWFEHLQDQVAVENVVNHVHLWDVLGPGAGMEAEAPLLLAPLASTWTSALRLQFPERTFRVEALLEGDYGPELTFHSA